MMLYWQFQAYLSWKSKMMGEENKNNRALTLSDTPATGGERAAALGW